jgi:hypothetical protein
MTDDLSIEIGSLVSAQTHEGLVELQVGGVTVQLPIPKAREVAQMLTGAIEAAISDQLLVAFLRDKVEISPSGIAKVLRDFRELRQGSRDTVYLQ